MASIIQTLYNLWQRLPTAVQGALIVLAFAVYVFAAGYTFVIPAGFVVLDPATWHLLFTVGAGFVVALWAAVFPIVRDKLWPALFAWILTLLGLTVVPGPVSLLGRPTTRLVKG